VPIVDTIHKADLQVAVWHITETTDELVQLLLPNSTYSKQLSDIVREKRKSEFLAVRLLVKKLLGDAPIIAYLPNGKPYLTDSSHYISISHTKNYAAVCISAKHEIGIDIETISDKVQQVKERFMNEAELVHAQQCSEFILLSWVSKEAAYKKIGKEVVHFAASMELVPFTPHTSGVLELKVKLEVDKTYTFYYQQHTEFVLVYG
jgi:4'-phosphopantetheinyl transferase